MGEVPPYSGPKTPDGRVSVTPICVWLIMSEEHKTVMSEFLHAVTCLTYGINSASGSDFLQTD